MARDLVKNMSGDFVPDEFPDQYNRTLMEIIRAKAEGGEIKATPRVEGAKIINLMEALKKSVQEAQARESQEGDGDGRTEKAARSEAEEGSPCLTAASPRCPHCPSDAFGFPRISSKANGAVYM